MLIPNQLQNHDNQPYITIIYYNIKISASNTITPISNTARMLCPFSSILNTIFNSLGTCFTISVSLNSLFSRFGFASSTHPKNFSHLKHLAYILLEFWLGGDTFLIPSILHLGHMIVACSWSPLLDEVDPYIFTFRSEYVNIKSIKFHQHYDQKNSHATIPSTNWFN